MIVIITTRDKGDEKKRAHSLGLGDGWSNRCTKYGEDNSFIQLRIDFRRKADTLEYSVCLCSVEP